MAELSDSGDPLALSSIDLDFHRAIASHSGNELAAQIWEGLAQHLVIVFCRDWSDADGPAGRGAAAPAVDRLPRTGSVDDIDTVLATHFSGPGLGARADIRAAGNP